VRPLPQSRKRKLEQWQAKLGRGSVQLAEEPSANVGARGAELLLDEGELLGAGVGFAR